MGEAGDACDTGASAIFDADAGVGITGCLVCSIEMLGPSDTAGPTVNSERSVCSLILVDRWIIGDTEPMLTTKNVQVFSN